MAPIADIITNSTGGLLPHSHKLVIPASVLEKGETTTLPTEFATSGFIFTHQHEVVITAEQIAAILKGETVVLKDNDKERHSFEVKVA
ncbi:hypothetical protein HDU79_004001 [Rhizoclosmatium sp. JEL0117]|nr:hypothetical protein HDU79_004001 [Rhizoclosmatium sp. JEL0117]